MPLNEWYIDTSLVNIIKNDNIEEQIKRRIQDIKRRKKQLEEEVKRKIMVGYNSNRVITSKHSGNNWCAKSEYVLQGAFESKISILKIDQNKAKQSWRYAVGLIKSNPSYDDNEYYKDSILLICDGNKCKFVGNLNQLLNYSWKSGDIILVKRDELNNIYFGINNDTKLAYQDISGPFRIVYGFYYDAIEGDIFELTELNES